jgi:glycosyltransferase involved in cell wall biosynthesis
MPEPVRLTILNQFYAPDASPTAQLAGSLASHRAARGDDLTVISGRAGYLPGLAHGKDGDPGHGAVRVHRVWVPNVGKSSVPRRLFGYASFLVGCTVRVLRLRRQDVIVAMTTPPLLVVIALLHRALHRRTRVVLWSMDCYPDAAERFGKLRDHGLLARLLRAVNRAAFRRLDAVVVLDGAMAELLASQYAAGPDRPPVRVIPNWEPADAFPPPGAARPWAGYEEMAVGDRIVVVYLGNTGVGHRFDTAVEAAARLREEAVFLFVGGGARRDELRQLAAERGADNVVLHDYLPWAEVHEVMAGADGALITLDDRSLGIISPSKLHANLAAGLPVLYVGPAGSNVDEAIQRFGCGTSLRNGDVDGLVAAVRGLRDGSEQRARARGAFEAAYTDAVNLPRWDALLDGGGRS